MTKPTAGEISVFCSMVEDYRNWSAQRVVEAGSEQARGEGVDAAYIALLHDIGTSLADEIDGLVHAEEHPPKVVLAVMAQLFGMLVGRWSVAQADNAGPLQLSNIVMNAIQIGVEQQKTREEVSLKRH